MSVDLEFIAKFKSGHVHVIGEWNWTKQKEMRNLMKIIDERKNPNKNNRYNRTVKLNHDDVNEIIGIFGDNDIFTTANELISVGVDVYYDEV